MRKDNRFRFSLQWGSDTQERITAGEFLEKLGNKKSDFIVTAIWEYLQRHPEALTPETRIKITTQPLFSKEQLTSEVRNMVTTYLDQIGPAVPAAYTPDGRDAPSENDLNDMLENMSAFGE